MKPIRHLRRLAATLAGLACAWLGLAGAAPTAFASMSVPPPGGRSARPALPPGWHKHPAPLPPVQIHQLHQPLHVPVQIVVAGGMPGWHVALIPIGAALLVATAAVLAYRAWADRRKPVTAGPEPSVPGADVLSVP